MNVFREENYKEIIKKRVKEVALLKAQSLTLRRLAQNISIQYTYLSKTLNHETTHLSEDNLYDICQHLEFFPDEVDFILLLRSAQMTNSPKRKDFLAKKISKMRKAKELHADQSSSYPTGREINFLLSPLAWLTFFALGIKDMRQDPGQLCKLLNINLNQLKSILQNLSDLDLIKTEGNLLNIIKVNKYHTHYGADHPLARIHQQMLRPFCDTRIFTLPEQDKYRFMATFNADSASVKIIRDKFLDFISEVEKVVVPAPGENTFQLNFDLFKWF